MQESKKRIAYWDNLKFFMILLVVLGHFSLQHYDEADFSEILHLFIYAFHMPVFFFISGVFYNRTKAKTSCIFYMTCGLLLKLGFALCSLILGEEVEFHLLYEGDIPWFMFALGYYYLFTYLLGNVNRKHVLVIGILLACMVGYEKLGDYLTLSRSILFFPFFVAGTMFTLPMREKATAAIKKYSYVFYPLAVIVLLSWGAACLFLTDAVSVYLPLFKGRSVYPDEIIPYGLPARLGCYLVSALTGTAVMVLCPHRRLKGITYMGTKTLNVYFWHWIFYLLTTELLRFDDLYSSGIAGGIAYYAISVLLCVALASVKLFDWPLLNVRKAIRSDGGPSENKGIEELKEQKE